MYDPANPKLLLKLNYRLRGTKAYDNGAGFYAGTNEEVSFSSSCITDVFLQKATNTIVIKTDDPDTPAVIFPNTHEYQKTLEKINYPLSELDQ